jgi:septal ring factor EnvC (AmiA/AmiB activator)
LQKKEKLASRLGKQLATLQSDYDALRTRLEAVERDRQFWYNQWDEVKEALKDRIRQRDEARGKLRRVRDWLKFAANSEGGIVAEMDHTLAAETKGKGNVS